MKGTKMKSFTMFFALLGAVFAVYAAEPAEFKVASGSIEVRLTKNSLWNIAGIWYNGKEVCRASGAISGTTLNFNRKGWCGSGHRVSGVSEIIESISFKVDGKEWAPVDGTVKVEKFEMVKRAKLYSAILEYRLCITGNNIIEYNHVELTETVDNATIYHAMHPWVKQFSDFIYKGRKGESENGKFSNEKRSSEFKKRPDYFAAFAPAFQCGWVTVITQPANFGTADAFDMTNRITDRKLYYVPVRGGKIRKNWKTFSIVATALYPAADAAQFLERTAAAEAELRKLSAELEK